MRLRATASVCCVVLACLPAEGCRSSHTVQEPSLAHGSEQDVRDSGPIGEQELVNVLAFARLLGYVRYFHPSDGAAGTDWDSFAAAGLDRVRHAKDRDELLLVLRELYLPIAPTVAIVRTGSAFAEEARSLPKAGVQRLLRWEHAGFGHGDPANMYKSRRISQPIAERRAGETEYAALSDPYIAALPGGVSVSVPLAVFADDKGTLPRSNEGPAHVPSEASGNRPGIRARRFADVVLAWNAVRHSYPYSDVSQIDWVSALRAALREAAIDADDNDFLWTLRRMLAALNDGHAGVRFSNDDATASLGVRWDWISGELVVTDVVTDGAKGLSVGDAIISVNGIPTANAIAEMESLVSAATPQWKRYRAMSFLARCRPGSDVMLEVEPYSARGERRRVAVSCDYVPQPTAGRRSEPLTEIEPGIFYVDLDRITTEEFQAALTKLAGAQGLVFDMRGYPRKLNMAGAFFPHLTSTPITSAQWLIPRITRPDGLAMSFTRGAGEWRIEPKAPLLRARKAFIADGRAISYAESCMGIVEHYRFGEIVGGATAGTNGNINVLNLADGYSVIWTGMKVVKHDGSQHHGVGILPTVPVAPTRAGIAAGRDELLEAAIATVRRSAEAGS